MKRSSDALLLCWLGFDVHDSSSIQAHSRALIRLDLELTVGGVPAYANPASGQLVSMHIIYADVWFNVLAFGHPYVRRANIRIGAGEHRIT